MISCPQMHRGFHYSARMPNKSGKATELPASRAARLLAQNIDRLMASDPDLSSNPKLSLKTKLTTSTLSRIRNAKVEATVGSVEAIAKAFGIEPWELLVPGFNPKNRPTLQPISEQERKLYQRLAEAVKEIKESP